MIDSGDCVVLFGTDGRLTLEALGYERPEARHVSDANWVKTRISIQSGPFSGEFEATFSTYDFAALMNRLSEAVKTLSGVVEFESTEGDLVFTIKLLNRGVADVSGVAKPKARCGATLGFSFETDQSALGQVTIELARLLRRLPIKDF